MGVITAACHTQQMWDRNTGHSKAADLPWVPDWSPGNKIQRPEHLHGLFRCNIFCFLLAGALCLIDLQEEGIVVLRVRAMQRAQPCWSVTVSPKTLSQK